MSQLRSILLVVGAAWICGACALHHEVVEVAEVVGPAPLLPAAAPPHGFLRVYTPTEEYDDDQALYFSHRSFSILAPDGGVLKYVRNADHRWDETPARVSIPVGSYSIRSRTRRGGIATVPVAVEQGRTTNVYLDGSFAGLEARRDPSAALPSVAAGRGDVVTLPDGEIIGWSTSPRP
jgi:hypothetical protein